MLQFYNIQGEIMPRHYIPLILIPRFSQRIEETVVYSLLLVSSAEHSFALCDHTSASTYYHSGEGQF